MTAYVNAESYVPTELRAPLVMENYLQDIQPVPASKLERDRGFLSLVCREKKAHSVVAHKESISIVELFT